MQVVVIVIRKMGTVVCDGHRDEQTASQRCSPSAIPAPVFLMPLPGLGMINLAYSRIYCSSLLTSTLGILDTLCRCLNDTPCSSMLSSTLLAEVYLIHRVRTIGASRVSLRLELQQRSQLGQSSPPPLSRVHSRGYTRDRLTRGTYINIG